MVNGCGSGLPLQAVAKKPRAEALGVIFAAEGTTTSTVTLWGEFPASAEVRVIVPEEVAPQGRSAVSTFATVTIAPPVPLCGSKLNPSGAPRAAPIEAAVSIAGDRKRRRSAGRDPAAGRGGESHLRCVRDNRRRRCRRRRDRHGHRQRDRCVAGVRGFNMNRLRIVLAARKTGRVDLRRHC